MQRKTIGGTIGHLARLLQPRDPCHAGRGQTKPASDRPPWGAGHKLVELLEVKVDGNGWSSRGIVTDVDEVERYWK